MSDIQVNMDRLRFKDWRELESLSGRKMGWWVQQMSNGMGDLAADDLVLLVWVAAKRDNPDFTREQAEELGPAALGTTENPTPSGDA